MKPRRGRPRACEPGSSNVSDGNVVVDTFREQKNISVATLFFVKNFRSSNIVINVFSQHMLDISFFARVKPIEYAALRLKIVKNDHFFPPTIC